jgi:hypothetical protein
MRILVLILILEYLKSMKNLTLSLVLVYLKTMRIPAPMTMRTVWTRSVQITADKPPP